MKHCGLHVGRPWEAYPRKKVDVRIGDLNDDQVYDSLMNSILAGYVFYIHFGCPCKTWGAAVRLNGCTRTSDCLQGDGSLPREVEANLEVDRVCALCAALIIAGGSSPLKIPQAHIFLSTARLPFCLVSHSAGNSMFVSAITVCNYPVPRSTFSVR